MICLRKFKLFACTIFTAIMVFYDAWFTRAYKLQFGLSYLTVWHNLIQYTHFFEFKQNIIVSTQHRNNAALYTCVSAFIHPHIFIKYYLWMLQLCRYVMLMFLPPDQRKMKIIYVLYSVMLMAIVAVSMWIQYSSGYWPILFDFLYINFLCRCHHNVAIISVYLFSTLPVHVYVAFKKLNETSIGRWKLIVKWINRENIRNNGKFNVYWFSKISVFLNVIRFFFVQRI